MHNLALLHDLEAPLLLRRDGETLRLDRAGVGVDAEVLAFVPPRPVEALGSRGFRQQHGARTTYVVGSMALGIGSVELVEAAARAGHLAFFGAAGLSDARVHAALDRLEQLGDAPYGISFVDDPADPEASAARTELLLERGVRCVEASGFLRISKDLVRLRCAGLRRGADGRVEARCRLVAKVSRPELAARYFAPPPARLLQRLVRDGLLTAEEAALGSTLPLAEDVTCEADSGGHTDRRPQAVLLPALLEIRDQATATYGYDRELRVGAAGGLGEPQAIASAYAMGADYVLLGSVHQACVESGTCDAVKELLVGASITDMTFAPAPDLFAIGGEVQVLRRGSSYAVVAARLAEIHRRYDGLEAIPPAIVQRLEEEVFRAPIESIWSATADYLQGRSIGQLERVRADPKRRMGATFRWYLAKTARWARDGHLERRRDFQIWSGPALGTFNRWVAGSRLEEREHRRIADVAEALLRGAAVVSRARALDHVEDGRVSIVEASRWHIRCDPAP
ncbi:MAG: PfaD family polyunsaturated fatty acid/polyketide biosynthesis protein [Nannocystaceae bacterium]